MNHIKNGVVYIVPTPIGNLSDITHRALITLTNVNIIAAENIQHTNILLKHFNIKNYLISMNKNNEKKQSHYLINELKKGNNVAIVSNAGTPIINDPGYFLVQQCYINNLKVIPLPGACAAIAALTASGISAHRFCYEGFIPSKKKARYDLLFSLKEEIRTIIFYESKHRILTSIKDIIQCIGPDRYLVIAKEITKKWESIYGAKAINILDWVQDNNYHIKGEIVLIMEGFKKIKNTYVSEEEIKTFTMLRVFLTLKKAVSITAKIHQTNKNNLYQYALKKEER